VFERSPFRLLVLLSCFLVAGASSAAVFGQDAPPPRTAAGYRPIDPQPVATGDKIEVIDFFWYGCPHCYDFQPALEDWMRRRPPDVAVRRIPVILRDSWAPHARIYYTLEALGEVGRLHREVYHGYHVQELHMSKPDVMVRWAVRHGIPAEKWLDAYNSPDVLEKVEQAKALTRAYGIQGTPSVVVDGRYLTSPSLAGGLNGMIPVIERLIEAARRQRAGK
jgi:thiol:disulfide interchange protein DsbA